MCLLQEYIKSFRFWNLRRNMASQLWAARATASRVPPEFDLLCCSHDWGNAACVHLKQRHLGSRVGGQEGRPGGLRPLHVPAGQAELEALRVVREEALAQRQANATEQRHVGGKWVNQQCIVLTRNIKTSGVLWKLYFLCTWNFGFGYNFVCSDVISKLPCKVPELSEWDLWHVQLSQMTWFNNNFSTKCFKFLCQILWLIQRIKWGQMKTFEDFSLTTDVLCRRLLQVKFIRLGLQINWTVLTCWSVQGYCYPATPEVNKSIHSSVQHPSIHQSTHPLIPLL